MKYHCLSSKCVQRFTGIFGPRKVFSVNSLNGICTSCCVSEKQRKYQKAVFPNCSWLRFLGISSQLCEKLFHGALPMYVCCDWKSVASTNQGQQFSLVAQQPSEVITNSHILPLLLTAHNSSVDEILTPTIPCLPQSTCNYLNISCTRENFHNKSASLRFSVTLWPHKRRII